MLHATYQQVGMQIKIPYTPINMARIQNAGTKNISNKYFFAFTKQKNDYLGSEKNI